MADAKEGDVPPERDVKDFSFKQMRKIRVFESPDSLLTSRSNLLVVSCKYGLTFVGCPKGLKVIKTDIIGKINDSDEGSMQNVVEHCPSTFLQLGVCVQFVGLSCDELTLSVCFENGNSVILVLFDVPTLGSPNPSNARFAQVSLGTDTGSSLGNLLWNPGFPSVFAVCLNTGTVSVMELTDTEVKTLASLPASVRATAICWSPKGKQLVVGHKDGRLTQYSHSLQVKNEIECPELFDEPHSVTDLLWITPMFFAAVYTSLEEGDIPKFLLISTPKNEPRSIKNFEDIHYVMSEERQPMFYLKHISEWSLMVSACSNGFEAAVLGRYGGEAPWEKWNFEETSRAEMPLTYNNDETFPMGIAIDFTSTKPITEGENQLPPAPMMLLLSTDGILCPFYMVNQTPNVQHGIMKVPEPLPQGGLRKPILSAVGRTSQQASGTVSLGTSGNSGLFSFSSPKQAVTAPSGPMPPGVPESAGTFSFSSPKQAVTAPSGPLPPGVPESAGTFSFSSTKQAVTTPSGPLPPGVPESAGTFSFSSTKQAVTTPSGPTPLGVFGGSGTFSFSSTKQSVPLALGATSQGAPGSLGSSPFFGSIQSTSIGSSLSQAQAASLLMTKTGVTPFSSGGQAPPLQSQTPALESGKAGASTQLVKPTPIVQTQPAAPKPPPPAYPQGLSFGDDRPKAISTMPSQVGEQARLVQPKPTPAKPPPSFAEAVQSNKVSTLQRNSAESSSSPKAPAAREPSQGFHLPGTPTETSQTRRSDVTKKIVSSSKDNTVEASVSEHIQEAIKKFDKELDDLRGHVKSMARTCRLADDDGELASFKRTTGDLGRSFREIRDTTKEQQKDIEEEKRKLLEAFEMLEDARIRQERRYDPKYVRLLKSRPLDPVNAKNMREIRNIHLHLDKTLREVNMMLDEQWNKENEAKRSIQRPALDDVYRTLRTNQGIVQKQATALEKIAAEMKNRQILSTSWQGSSVHTYRARDGDLSTLASSLLDPKPDVKSPTSPKIPAPVSPQKQAQLRSILGKRRTTPVRRSRIVPRTINKSPSLESNRREGPFSSTPFVQKNGTLSNVVSEDEEPEEEGGAAVARGVRAVPTSESVKSTGPPVRRPAAVPEGPKGRFTLGDVVSTGNGGPSEGGPQPDGSSKQREEVQAPRSSVRPPESTKPAVQMFKLPTSSESTQAESVGQPLSSSSFSAFEVKPTRATMELSNAGIKPLATQVTITDTQSVAPKLPFASGAFLPAARTQASSTSQVSSTSETTSNAKAITTETPPSIAAAMAAMNRASAAKGSPQPSSNLDPSASIEPATLVAYRPATQQETQSKDYDSGTIAAKAIANAALMAATAEAQKPSTKPQSSTEFTFKSTDSSKPGPPVVTFKPAVSPPRQSEDISKGAVAPNITVKPASVFKPTVLPVVSTAVPASSSNTPALLFKGTQAAGPFSQLPVSNTSTGFSSATGPFFTLGATSLPTALGSSAFSFGSKLGELGDTKTPGQKPLATSAAGSLTFTSSTDIAPSPRVSRTLFTSPASSLQTKSTVPSNPSSSVAENPEGSDRASVGHDQGDSQESPISGVKEGAFGSSTAFTVSGTTSTTVTTTTATAPLFKFATPTASGGGVFSNLASTNTAFGLSNPASSSSSIMGALMRTSGAGGAVGSMGSLFAAVPPSDSKGTAPAAAGQLPLSPVVSPSDNSASTVASSTTSVAGTSGGTGSLFAPVLANTGALPPASSLVGSSTVSTVKTGPSLGGLSPLPSAGTQGGMFAPTTTSTTRAVFGSVTTEPGHSFSAFSATTTPVALFPGIKPASAMGAVPSGIPSVSTATGGSPFVTSPPLAPLAAPKSASEGAPSANPTGLFGQIATTTSAFGVVPTTANSGAGLLSSVTTLTTANSPFGAAVSTSAPFSTTPGLGASGGSTFGGAPTFGTQGSTFGSAPVFGSASSTPGTGALFGTSATVPKTTFGQSSFSSSASGSATTFGQMASKPPDNALGFGFSGFGLGGQSSSQANKNPFGTAQGFGSVTTDTSLFGGKSGADVFKQTESSKPSFGSGSFSGFGSQPSGGFSGGSFASQGGGVAAAGFGVGPASSPAVATGFGSSPSFGSPSSGGSVFGGTPAFGSSPSFGTGPSFGGSPQGGLGTNPAGGVFGSGSPGGFAQASSGSPTFGLLASQSNVPTFGALAGQSPTQGFGAAAQQQQQGMGFGSFSGGGTQNAGGTSFQQWR